MCYERFILFLIIFKQLVQTLNIPIAVECQVKQVIYTVMPLLSAKLAKTAPRIATTKLVMQITDFTLAASTHYYRKLPGKQKRARNCLPLQSGFRYDMYFSVLYCYETGPIVLIKIGPVLYNQGLVP